MMKFYSQTMNMIVKTFLNDKGLVRTVIYELPRHEAVNKYTKMTLVEEKGYWSVVADVFPHQGLSVVPHQRLSVVPHQRLEEAHSRLPQNAKSQVPCENTRTELKI